MAILIVCQNPECRQPLSCPEEMAGKQVQCAKCGTVLDVPPAATPPASASTKRLGHYTLVRKLGEGGMGAVYEAIQEGLDRRVALKVLPQRLMNDPAYLERFQREAKAAAALDHPNIVQVHEIGQDKGHYFFSMQFVDGESLQKRLSRDGKLSVPDALSIVFKVAEALDYAWTQAKIIHRDIKPDNILLTKQGHVKLADLGLAKSTREEKGVTATGAGLGTPYYMAPEQAEDARRADHRADIYALGITLLHLLTGKRPFDGDSAYGIIIAHTTKPLPSGKDLGTELPAPVESLIRKMCAKKPDERYQDYPSLLADLERAKAGQPTLASTKSEAALPTLVSPGAAQPAAAPALPTPRPHARREKPKSRAGLFIGIGSVVAVLIAAVVFVASRASSRETPSAGVSAHGGVAGPKKPAEAVTTNKGTLVAPPSSLVVPPLGGSGGEKPPAKAGTTNEESGTAIEGMFQEAEKYSQEHPGDFARIVEKFEKVMQRAQGTAFELKAEDQAKTWRKKWDVAAQAEFDSRKESAEAQVQAGRFDAAAKLWTTFPEIFLTENFRNLVEEEKKKVTERLNSLPQELSAKAEPLLAKEPEQLGEQDIGVLIAIKVQAESPPAGMAEESLQALKSLLEKVDATLEAFQDSKAGERAKAFDAFWDKFVQLIKDRKFDDAEALVAANSSLVSSLVVPASAGSSSLVVPASAGSSSLVVPASADSSSLVVTPLGGPGEEKKPAEAVTTNTLVVPPLGGSGEEKKPAEAVTKNALVVTPLGGSGEEKKPAEAVTTNLASDARLLKDLFARAEANLGQLAGKTVRLGGTGMKVSGVRGGKLIVSEGRRGNGFRA